MDTYNQIVSYEQIKVFSEYYMKWIHIHKPNDI